ncbi:MAG: site-specific DNA-methyltransferase [Selenomonas sp.]|uniref:site-specific DNA-methyltransferase n=1 Tax=Selenomonas sp. TaxID=2053611 RepID=UPI0025DF52A9|nr:site-specific DNA-methyltransferase [Selenomonas sp.]MCR5758449.1 site-specific DNA-methyltransferase [Selenomonas sp.]
MPCKKKEMLTEKEIAKMRTVDAYEHSGHERANNPKAGYARYDRVKEETTKYAYDPHIDPALQWAGKQEGSSFEVPTSSIHIHESIKPHKILRKVMKAASGDYQANQISLFPNLTPLDTMRARQQDLQFYKHGVDWTNRLIAGDSLVIMNSLLQKEGMAGKVQMVYFDPPYGIKYGSNFQPFVNQRDVKDGKDADLSQEPEMITAFRDTWELGIHSYLSYLRDRLLLARDLLADSGSVFVQISDENVHHVREICDEVFGPENCASFITFYKTASQTASTMASTTDYILWYAKDKSKMKYHQLYLNKDMTTDKAGVYRQVELVDGTRRNLTKEELAHPSILPKGAKIFRKSSLTSQSGGEHSSFAVRIDGKDYYPGRGFWKTNESGMKNLIDAKRVITARNSINYVRYIDDFPVYAITNLWTDTGTGSFTDDKIYVVQTGTKVIKRCMLMTTDPGDLVLDITCGSGTTAYVAEQWGRRWITCDTSRVAIDLTKQRLMTATYDYYRLAHPEQGVDSGFVYKTVPHITLKSIANNYPPATETLYDQPEIDKTKIRVTGPFTVESLPATTVKPIDGEENEVVSDMTAKQDEYREEILATGVIGKGGEKLKFTRVEAAPGNFVYVQAIGETEEDSPRKAAIHFGSETKVLDAGRVEDIFDEVQSMRPTPHIIIIAAYQFDPEATKLIEETKWPDMQIFAVQMNTDLMTSDLKKKRSSNQSFFFIGQPDVELIHDGRTKDVYKVRVNGFDYYDPKTGKVKSGSANNIAMWMLDEDYDGGCIEPEQIFFPLGGKSGGWHKLAKTLKAELDQEAIEQYAGNISLPFKIKPGQKKVAVKIIDDRGIESMKVLKVGEDNG